MTCWDPEVTIRCLNKVNSGDFLFSHSTWQDSIAKVVSETILLWDCWKGLSRLKVCWRIGSKVWSWWSSQNGKVVTLMGHRSETPDRRRQGPPWTPLIGSWQTLEEQKASADSHEHSPTVTETDWVPWATKTHSVNSLQWHHMFYSHLGKGVEARLVSSHFFFPLPRISCSWRNSSSQKTSTGFVKLGGLWQSLYVTHLERKDWCA